MLYDSSIKCHEKHVDAWKEYRWTKALSQLEAALNEPVSLTTGFITRALMFAEGHPLSAKKKLLEGLPHKETINYVNAMGN